MAMTAVVKVSELGAELVIKQRVKSHVVCISRRYIRSLPKKKASEVFPHRAKYERSGSASEVWWRAGVIPMVGNVTLF